MGRVAVWVSMVAVLAAGVGQTAAQRATVAPPETSVGVVLRNLAARAGVVFVGQVVRIEHKAGTVEIVFQVQQPVLGAVGATYTLREWGGLWTGGQQRYRLGQRAMVFLHTASSASPGGVGLSSPVDGMDGIVPVVVQGADAAPLLDVRWLAARVLRPQGAPIANADNGAITLADGAAIAAAWKQSEWHEPLRRPLPVGVRPAQPVQEQAGGSAAGLVTGTTVGPLEFQSGLKFQGVHGTVEMVTPGGPDAIR